MLETDAQNNFGELCNANDSAKNQYISTSDFDYQPKLDIEIMSLGRRIISSVNYDYGDRRPNSLTSYIEGRDTVSMYLSTLSDTRLLKREEEHQLGRRIRLAKDTTVKIILDGIRLAGGASAMFKDEEKNIDNIIDGNRARNEFIDCNRRLVVSVAKKYIGNGLELDDLIQDGNSILGEVIDRFDEQRGTKFSTHATKWLMQFFSRRISDFRVIRIPNDLDRIAAKARSLQKDGFTLLEIKDETGLSEEKIAEILAATRVNSINSTITEDQNTELIDLILDAKLTPVDEAATQSHGRSELIEYLKHVLSTSEFIVITESFGFNDDGLEKPTVKIAELIDRNVNTVRAKKAKALKTLSLPAHAGILKSLLEH